MVLHFVSILINLSSSHSLQVRFSFSRHWPQTSYIYVICFQTEDEDCGVRRESTAETLYCDPAAAQEQVISLSI